MDLPLGCPGLTMGFEVSGRRGLVQGSVPRAPLSVCAVFLAGEIVHKGTCHLCYV